jgi:microcystin-dependent protein
VPLETATHINGLDPANPASGDVVSQGDDHLRLIKSTLRNTFPNVTGAVTATQAQLNLVPSWASSVNNQPWVIPPGALMPFSFQSPPPGWIKANGAVLNRADFPALWAAALADGVVTDAQWSSGNQGRFSSGNGSTTFRVPDLRGEFIRAWDDGRGVDTGRAIGTQQSSQNLDHNHPGSTAQSQGAHTHPGSSVTGTGAHSHSGTTSADGAHAHGTPVAGIGPGGGPLQAGASAQTLSGATSPDGVHIHSFSVGGGDHGHGINIVSDGAHTHPLTINPNGGSEARPRNIALLWCIKT